MSGCFLDGGRGGGGTPPTPPGDRKNTANDFVGCTKHNRPYEVGGSGTTRFYYCPECDKERERLS